MSDRKVLIGDIASGIVLHQQGDWSTGNDRIADPDGRVLALLSEIGEPGGGGSALGSVNTIYVDAERTDVYTADGTFDKPYVLVQDGIDALVAMTPDGSELHGALVVSPSGKYLAQTDELVMTLPSDSVTIRNLAIVTDSIGAAKTTVLPPLRIDSPSNASSNTIALRGLTLESTSAATTDKVLYVKGHASFTGKLLLSISDVQVNAIHTGKIAFYVDNGGGDVLITASGQTVFYSDENNNSSVVTMTRGRLVMRGCNVVGGDATAINLSGAASLSMSDGQLSAIGMNVTTLVYLAGTASINLRDVAAGPVGPGDVIYHGGTGGFIGVHDVLVDDDSPGMITASAGVTVLLGVCVHNNGLPVEVMAQPSQIVRLIQGVQVNYESVLGSWAGTTPPTIGDAVDRLAEQLAAHLGNAIP